MAIYPKFVSCKPPESLCAQSPKQTQTLQDVTLLLLFEKQNMQSVCGLMLLSRDDKDIFQKENQGLLANNSRKADVIMFLQNKSKNFPVNLCMCIRCMCQLVYIYDVPLDDCIASLELLYKPKSLFALCLLRLLV